MSTYFEARNDDDVLQINDEVKPLCVLKVESLWKYYVESRAFRVNRWLSEENYPKSETGLPFTAYTFELPVIEGISYYISNNYSDEYIGLFMNVGAVPTRNKNTSGIVVTEYSDPKVIICMFDAYNMGFDDAYRIYDPKIVFENIKVYTVGAVSGKAATHGTGVEIYNADGNRVFSSAFPPIRILKQFTEKNISETDTLKMPRADNKLMFTEDVYEYSKSIAFNTNINFFGASWNSKEDSLAGSRFPMYLLGRNKLRTAMALGMAISSDGYEVYDQYVLGRPDYLITAAEPRVNNYTSYTIIDASLLS